MAPFTTKSDFARRHADAVALAACKGLISTRFKQEHYSRTWRITALGLQWLNATEVDE